jgi:hypothetical protein
VTSTTGAPCDRLDPRVCRSNAELSVAPDDPIDLAYIVVIVNQLRRLPKGKPLLLQAPVKAASLFIAQSLETRVDEAGVRVLEVALVWEEVVPSKKLPRRFTAFRNVKRMFNDKLSTSTCDPKEEANGAEIPVGDPQIFGGDRFQQLWQQRTLLGMAILTGQHIDY